MSSMGRSFEPRTLVPILNRSMPPQGNGRPQRNRNMPLRFKDYVMVMEQVDGESYLSCCPIRNEDLNEGDVMGQ
jgi:hypothetical protein